MIGLLQAVSLATSELIRMALAGELGPREVWTALRGAEKYRRAVASGDVASEPVQEVRASVCWACPSSTSRTTAAGATGGYCGEAFRDKGRTCGCLVLVRVNGETLPAGKTVVGSEKCPQNRW